MAEIGIMVYGFDRDTAKTIKEGLEEVNKGEVALISGSGREEHLVGDILEDEQYDLFEAKDDPRVVMFLGFDGKRINSSIDEFPKIEGPRPIFCTPTEKNIEWTLSALLEDLMEEREYFRKKRRENNNKKN